MLSSHPSLPSVWSCQPGYKRHITILLENIGTGIPISLYFTYKLPYLYPYLVQSSWLMKCFVQQSLTRSNYIFHCQRFCFERFVVSHHLEQTSCHWTAWYRVVDHYPKSKQSIMRTQPLTIPIGLIYIIIHSGKRKYTCSTQHKP